MALIKTELDFITTIDKVIMFYKNIGVFMKNIFLILFGSLTFSALLC